MKELYEISTDLILYVMAESEDEALTSAMCNIPQECDNLRKNDFEITHPVEFYYAIWEDVEPYGSDDSRTVKQIFEDEKEDEEKDRLAEQERIEWEKKQIKMFE